MLVRNRRVHLKVHDPLLSKLFGKFLLNKHRPRLFLYFFVFSLVSPSPPVAGKLILHSCLILVTNDFRHSHTYHFKPKRLLLTRCTSSWRCWDVDNSVAAVDRVHTAQVNTVLPRVSFWGVPFRHYHILFHPPKQEHPLKKGNSQLTGSTSC